MKKRCTNSQCRRVFLVRSPSCPYCGKTYPRIHISSDKTTTPAKPKRPLSRHMALLQSDIAILNLSVRSYNCLYRRGIHTIQELLRLSPEELKLVRNLGRKSYEEVINALARLGFRIAPEYYIIN